MNVFITGASSGLGEALAHQYAKAGATLGLFARRRDRLLTLRETLTTAFPSPVHLYEGDVTDAQALQRAAQDFLAQAGVPDIVIANAGVSHGTITGGEGDADLPVFREVFDTNVMGIVNTFHPFIDAMREARQGTLVGVASVAGFRGLPGSSAYSASKAAAISYLESLRVELRGSGVAVVTLCPGFIATPMTANNPYPMPFLISATEAADLMVRAIARKKRRYVFPWPMMLASKLLRVLPDAVYDALFAHAPHKPRK
ncbi:MAG: SDR family oxidoreductase [Proteobacteria bacterium]|nr:SDR family oxidoreductase [Pseudomonadota bacterium]MCL2308644.1 SDR family oxidoreductase [Pseudomonadota bacterium]